ncbi:MAG: hypothetical protein AB8B55_19385 [Mariniblastus sp.]
MQTHSRYPASFIVLLAMMVSATAQAQDKIDLAIDFAKSGQSKVTANYEHTGSVIVTPDDPDEKPRNLPLAVTGKQSYFQRPTSSDQAIRFFEIAEANISLEKGKTTPKLGESNRLVIARLKSKPGRQVELASISGTLDQSELELIQNAGDPLTLGKVFSKSGLKVGDKWDPKAADLAKLLGVHKINKSDVQLLLKKADAQHARVYIMGAVDADVNDVTTSMEISGIAIIDRKKQAVTSFKLGLREVRQPGQIAPGFEGKTKVDLRITYGADSPRLTNASLAKYTKSRKIRQRLKWAPEASDISMTYDPHWKLIAAERDAAILRYIDRGDLLTQCNLVQLPTVAPGKTLSLEQYKTEVGKIVATDKKAKLVKASQVKTESGLKALQVIVSGEEEGLAVNWLYYHVSGNDGRQVTLVFTLAEEVAGKVKPLAEQLVNEFEFKAIAKRPAANKKSAARQSQKPAPRTSRTR